MMITVAIIAMHLLFVCWGIVNIFRLKIKEVEEDSRPENNGGNNVVKTTLRDIPKANKLAIEISVINPLFKAKVGKQSTTGLSTS